MARNRVFAVSLAISMLFHLSMVTLFSIVLLFERREMPFVQFELMQEAADRGAMPADAVDSLRLRAPDVSADLAPTPRPLEDLAEHDLTLKETLVPSSVLPPIELPTLGFAELERLRLRQETMSAAPDIERFLGKKPRDPWARFGQELGQLTDALIRLRHTLDPSKDDVESPQIQLVSRPAPGFAAYIEWLSEPQDRVVLSTPPVRALWGLDPNALESPITLIFTVNPEGRVTEVLNPVEDDLTTSVGIALSKYRFAPLFDADAGNQQGTFRIAADEDR